MTYTAIDFDTYQMICDLLWEHEDMELADIAELAGQPLDVIQYVARAESETF